MPRKESTDSAARSTTDRSSPNTIPEALEQLVRGRNVIQCYEHGCNGRIFSDIPNYMRHCREKDPSNHVPCSFCGALFTRKGNMEHHITSGRCKMQKFLEEILEPRLDDEDLPNASAAAQDAIEGMANGLAGDQLYPGITPQCMHGEEACFVGELWSSAPGVS